MTDNTQTSGEGIATITVSPDSPQPTVVPDHLRMMDQPTQTQVEGTQTAAQPTTSTQVASNTSASKDMRIRISALDSTIYSGITQVLSRTNGMVFPYTPQIAYSQAVAYQDLALVHSNTDYQAYTRTPSVTISLTGKFTVQSQWEGEYALACLHFLRAASKSYFGEKDERAGLPPPVLVLDGYGKYMFNGLRVLLKSHSWTFDENTDTIVVTAGSTSTSSTNQGIVRLPAMFSITCELVVIQTPARMRNKFSFARFASGALMDEGGWI